MEVKSEGENGLGAGDASVIQNQNPSQNPVEGVNVENEFIIAIQKYELVADKLVSFLNFEDMKSLSEVSSSLLHTVRRTNKFAKRAKLLVCKEIIPLGLLNDCTYQWKHLFIDLSLPIEVLDLIEDLLENAESIQLRLPSPDAIEDKILVDYLIKILRQTKHLESLDIDVTIMSKVLHDVFSDAAIQTLLSKIKCLNIHGYTPKPGSLYYIDGSEEDSETPFQRNFLQLSMIPLQLKKFALGKVLPLYGSESDHVKFIPNIVQTTKETLEELALHLNVWKFQEMKSIRCPNLKRLTISANGNEHAEVVQTFLQNQPPLEELTIELNNHFPVKVLLTLQGKVSRMKKLHLKAKQFSGTSGPVDWSFLALMNQLEEFSLKKPSGTNDLVGDAQEIFGYGEDILGKLPTSTRKISLRGFPSFWRDNNIDRNIGIMLSRFDNVTGLNLLRSCEAVNDLGLQSLIANCPNIVSLSFSHCPEVTNFGITGINNNEDENVDPGPSLNNLKGLLHLNIRSCPNIAPENLLEVCKFPHLRTFDYYKNIDLPKEYLFSIVEQNPCLEEVAIHIITYENDGDYLSDLRKQVKEKNPRVHKIEVLERSNWEDEDSDSDASSLQDNGSDFSGGGYPGPGGFFDEYDEFDDDESPYFDDYDDPDEEDDFEF